MVWSRLRRQRARRRQIGLARVEGESMRPALEPGDLLLVVHGGRPRPGRPAVVRLPGGRPVGVKRLIDEDADGWWVASDNSDHGTDSRTFGRLPGDAVIATVVGRVWPRPRRRTARRRG